MRYSEQICIRFQQAVEILGKRWTGLILQALMGGSLRFSEISERLEVVSDRTLAERLRELERTGLVAREVYAEVPVRVVYSLTEKGRALGPVIESIEHWSEQWIEPAPADAVPDGVTRR